MKISKIKGFTLIELLMVISIIGLLSSVVLGGLNIAREKARIASGMQFSSNIKSALGDREIIEWNFNGNNLTDLSSNNRTGVVGGGTVSYDSTGMFGDALVLDGSSYVTAQDNEVFGPTDAITIEMWIKPRVDIPASCPGNAYQNIVNNSTWWGPWSIILECGMTIKFSASEDYGVSRRGDESTKTIKAGKWTHVAMSADKNRMRGYIDGRLVAEAPLSVSSIGINGSAHVTTGPMGNISLLDRVWLGRQGGGGYFFDGQIDNIRIYRGALMGDN